MPEVSPRDLPHAKLSDAAAGRAACPVCGEPLFGWLKVKMAGGHGVVLERCEECGLGAPARGAEEAGRRLGELAEDAGEEATLTFPNRLSLQASIGGASWPLLDPARPFHLTPEAAIRLLRQHGLEPERSRALAGPSLTGMWKTMIDSATFDDDTAWRRAFNRVVTVLVALPAAIVAVPLELASWIPGRGGVVEVRARRAG